jgi:SAM-dependent methyltransferase
VADDHFAAHGAWDKSWASVQDTVSDRDGWFLLEEIKLKRLLTFLPSKGKTLEVGCGSARLSAFLARQGHSAVCLDYSLNAIAAARRNFSRLGLTAGPVAGRFLLGDAFRLPFRSGSFDAVLSTGLLEHFEDPSGIVREMVRVLAPGGLFYSDVVPKKFSTFRISGLWQALRIGGERVFEGAYGPRNIREWTDSADRLESVRILGAGVLPPYRLTCRPPWARKAVFALKPLWERLEGGFLGRLLGCYYFVTGRKKSP